jgi:putative heme iron utilization protein
VWISCRARKKGRCALSGAVIQRDDFVYKPRVRSAVPANANAMILASVIARIPAMA